MPTKSFSALQRVTQTLRGYLKNYRGKTLLEKNDNGFSFNFKQLNNRAWPEREENFAAIQLLRQTRNWNNFRKVATNETQAYLPEKKKHTSRRNLLSEGDDDRFTRSDAYEQSLRKSDVDVDEDDDINYMEESDEKNDGRPRVGTLQEVVFGRKEKDDSILGQLKADNELLSQVVVKHRPVFSENSLSKKVIAPYTTYKTHRNNWAEFRHRMVYGGRRY